MKEIIEYQDGDGSLGLEASGGYEEPLMIWMDEHTLTPVTRLNPYRIKAFSKSRSSRAKTNAQDGECPDPEVAVLPDVECAESQSDY